MKLHDATKEYSICQNLFMSDINNQSSKYEFL